MPSELSAAEAAAEDGTDDGSVVDVLVVWTPAAEEDAGGERQMLSQVDLTIAFTNDAFERSGALVQLNLVGAERVDYLEAGIFTDLDRLAAPDDGYIDGVHDRRNVLGADLIYLVNRLDISSGASGVAHLGGPFGAGELNLSIFPHEVGHNFGIQHERLYIPTGYEYSFTTEGCDATIVSYGSASSYGPCFALRRRLPFYASPWRYDPRDGHALGVSRFSKVRGRRGPADAVLKVNRFRHTVANWRPSRSPGSGGIELRRSAYPKKRQALLFLEPRNSEAGPRTVEVAEPRAAVDTEQSETLVDIPDTTLRKAVEEALIKAPGDPITRGEMATLRKLVAVTGSETRALLNSGNGVRQLTGIEHAVNLNTISLSNRPGSLSKALPAAAITDLSPLADLTSLTDIHLDTHAISDLSPLSDLTALRTLSLESNEIWTCRR